MRFYTVIFTCIVVLLLTDAIKAATFTVTKTADTNDSVCDADCSLREAINAANVAVTDDVIEFDLSIFNTAQTITLTGISIGRWLGF